MKTKDSLRLVAIAACMAVSIRAGEISLETAPPVVVRTAPAAGATDVDPSITEIKVTFSKPMQDGSWSWSTWGEENFPETTGPARYLADGRTCVLPVKLQPNKFYAIWLNSEKFKNFKDTNGRPAVPYLLTFVTAQAGVARAAVAQATFGPVVETVLNSTKRPVAEMLDLDTGLWATNAEFGRNDRETHAWVRSNRVDILGVLEKDQIGVLCMDMAVVPGASNGWDTIKASEVVTNFHLNQQEPKPVTAVASATDKSDTFLFLTREGSYGVLQILGQSDTPHGVKIRYKLVRKSLNKIAAGGNRGREPETFMELLNNDQRAVLAWTDRQFRSFFDNRTFEDWSAEERTKLEKRLIDALDGPRSTEYYQAINTLAALRSTNALPRLRQIAFERVDRNNRDRWMCVRALGIIGDKSAVPELIHLVYHGNSNTRWWAQISLVRLTGKNFGSDWNAWGKWWTESGGQPPYNPEIIRWWSGQPEPEKLAASLQEGDRKFLEEIRAK